MTAGYHFALLCVFTLLNLSVALRTGDSLRSTLLKHYDRVARPNLAVNATTITFGMTLTHVDLDEITSELTTHGWVQMAWSDARLAWDPNEFGGIKSIHFDEQEIWKPDIYLCNSAQAGEIGTYGSSNMVVHYDGSILWVPPAKFRSFCDLELKIWPFDVQTCKLKFGSWSYSGSHVDLQTGGQSIELDLVTKNAEWALTNVDTARNSQFYPCCPEPYIDITYTLHMARRSEGFCTGIMLAMITVTLLSLSAFLLPTHSGIKIMVNSVNLIFICFVLYAMAERLPALTYKPPKIALSFGCFLLMTVVSFCESVLVIKLSNSNGTVNFPTIVNKALFIGKVDTSNSFGEVLEGTGSNGGWHQVAVALDRCFFVVYAVLYSLKIFCFYAMV
ncbi:neuronal acetylcholine receptor subunit alpha-7-like isoform X2 [Cloeon dipterum]|uniref:neuronal acetylcholine receptor subunit alpha-7-like isoform X2 n=1 Tax=Cloeon dipterum TaxID=197152 RepID=UPI0032207795